MCALPVYTVIRVQFLGYFYMAAMRIMKSWELTQVYCHPHMHYRHRRGIAEIRDIPDGKRTSRLSLNTAVWARKFGF